VSGDWQRLEGNGYLPIPIRPNDKRPVHYDWRTRPAGEQFEDVAEHCGIGLLTDGITGGDVDLEDAEHACIIRDLIESRLGRGLRRTGRRGVMLVYTDAEPGEKISVTIQTTDAETGKPKTRKLFEWLRRGQQFVADGVHPDTGKPYRYDGPSPYDVSVAELPAVTEQELRDTAEAVAAKLTELGYRGVKVSFADRAADVRHSTGEPVTADMARKMLSHVDPDCDRDTWINILTAIKRLHVTLPDAVTPDPDFCPLELAKDWSRGDLGGANV